MSLLGDAAVPTMLWLAWEHPLWFAAALALSIVLAITLLLLTFKFLRALIRRFTGGGNPAPA